jgi:hypothetical protein
MLQEQHIQETNRLDTIIKELEEKGEIVWFN